MTTRVQQQPLNPETHFPNGARRPNTSETATPRPAPSVAQVHAQQKPTEYLDRDGNIKQTVPARRETGPVAEVHSREALARNTGHFASNAGAALSFDGNTGEWKTLDGNLPDGTLLIAILQQLRHGFIRFRGEGEAPDIVDQAIDDTRPPLTRDDIPEGYEQEPGMDGALRDCWQEQFRVPMLDSGEDGELFIFTARNAVSRIAVQALLGRCLRHSKYLDGLCPIIKIGKGAYFNKKLKVNKPKPVMAVIGWSNPDGTATAPKPAPKPEFNDDVPY
jgi:hypothetical protein